MKRIQTPALSQPKILPYPRQKSYPIPGKNIILSQTKNLTLSQTKIFLYIADKNRIPDNCLILSPTKNLTLLNPDQKLTPALFRQIVIRSEFEDVFYKENIYYNKVNT